MPNVYGTYTNPDGSPARGTVTFTPRGWSRDIETDVIVPATPLVVPIIDGQMTVTLPSITEVWEVVEQVGDATNLIVTVIPVDVSMAELVNMILVGQAGPHEHSGYPTIDQFNELLVEVESIAASKAGGTWQHTTPFADEPGTFTLNDLSFEATDNSITLHNIDANDETHGWAGVEVGDYLDVVQTHGTSAGIYIITAITDTAPDAVSVTYTLALYRGQGAAVDDVDFMVKIYHLANTDLAELDEKFAAKSHDHSYASTSHKHDGYYFSADGAVATYFETSSSTAASPTGFFAHSYTASGSSTYGGAMHNTSIIEFKSSDTGFYGRPGRHGTLIGSTTAGWTSSILIVFNVHELSMTNMANHKMYGSTIWCRYDPRDGTEKTWTQFGSTTPVYWYYRGAHK